jgi:hypothetical protein
MTSPSPVGVSIHSDGLRLILPRELDEREIAHVRNHKAKILTELR